MAEFLDADAASAKPGFRRRWLQFGFSTLLKLVALAAVLSAWWADRERLTERIGRLESDQTVLRIAMGDGFDYPRANPYGALPLVGRAIPSSYPSTAPPTGAVIACFGDPDFSSRDLYVVLQAHRDWLKTNCAADRGWQDFLAKGEPPETGDLPPDVMDPAHGATVKQCLPAMAKLLAASDVNARRQAAVLLRRAGAVAAFAAPDLAAAASDGDQEVREAALIALVSLGPAAKDAAPRLDALMRARDARSHPVQVAQALLAIDPQADVLPHLVQSLRDERPEIRAGALDLLSTLEHSRAAAAVPDVAALIADENLDVRSAAIETYSRLADRQDAIALFEAALASEEQHGLKRYLARTIVRLKDGPLER